MTNNFHTKLANSELSIFPLALGGNVFGWTANKTESEQVLDAFVSGGGNFIDTADSYSHWVPGNEGGESETIIGQWAKSRSNRDDLVIATKVFSHPKFSGLSASNIKAAAEASLSRLQSDRIDLYYAHYDDAETPIEESAAAMSKLVDEGKVRYLALSNFSAERIDEWFRVAEENGLHKPIALQPHYNLVERDYEQTLLPVALKHELSVFPYFALAKGFLTGKYRTSAADSQSPRAEAAAGYLEKFAPLLPVLDELAEKYQTAPAAISLAWLRQQPSIAAPIASARTVEQLPALLESARFELEPVELQRLGDLSKG